MNTRILIVEDDVEMCKMLEAYFRRRGAEASWCTSADQGFSALSDADWDILLADLNLPGMNGIELCQRMACDRPDIPVIIMTAFGSMESAISAIRAGAYDFLTKPVDLDLLSIAVERAVNHRRLHEKVQVLTRAVEQARAFDEMIGESQPMRDLFSKLARIAETDASVLIFGESGSGKELAARALHHKSRRKSGPFVAINCSALPDALLESELFGHKKGAFTDAKTDRKGLFLEAQHGTLFLDEIGDLSLNLQPKLLRVIQERRVRPVGGNQEIEIDARMIAATHLDLESAVAKGEFREDLFYRINVVQIQVPSLRVRGTDILLLARHFLKQFSVRLEKQVSDISEAAAAKLLNYRWPGNVRELANAVEHAVALTRYDKIAVEDLPEKIQNHQNENLPLGIQHPAELVTMEEIERRYIRHVLNAVDNNRTRAARILGMDRKTLYRKIERYGLD